MSNVPNVVPPTGGMVITWADEMKELATQQAAQEQPEGKFFSLKSGQLTFDGVAIPNNTMDVVIIASAHENVYYEGRFDQTTPASPKCFAFSTTGEAGMKPHPNVPQPENATCKGCPRDAWGSDPNGGKGKACKNRRRLAVITAACLKTPEDVGKASVGYLRLPVTSVKHYKELVAKITATGRPTFCVPVRVKVMPDAKSQFSVQFEPIFEQIDPAVLQALLARHKQETLAITFPYDTSDAAAQANTPGVTTPGFQQKF